MKWIGFFLLAFVGIFVGLLFVTGVAQKQIIPLAKARFARVSLPGQHPADPADSTGSSAGGGEPAQPLASSGAAGRDSAASPSAPADSAAVASAAALDAARSAQAAAVARALPVPRTPEQQARDAVIAKIYGEMSADEAVKILKQLDDVTALAIVSHLKADKAARLLQAFGPERSVRITQIWASVGAGETAAP